MKKTLAIAQNYIARDFRSPITLIMAFVMPLIFTAVLGVALDEGDGTDTRIPVLLVDEDGGAMAQNIALALENSEIVKPAQSPLGEALPATRAEAVAALDDYVRVLFLPAGFGAALLNGDPVTAEFLVDDDTNRERNLAAEQELSALLGQVSNAVSIARQATEQAAQVQPFDSEAAEQAYFEAALADAQDRLSPPAIGVKRELAVDAGVQVQEAEGANQSSPGNLVTFGMITLLSVAVMLVSERNQGTLSRLVSSPVSKLSILAGKTFGPLAVGLIQMSVLILVGQFVFGVRWGQSPAALALIVITFDLAAVSLGILLSTIARTVDQAVGMMIGTSMATAALGGAWWPMDIVPPTMRTIGHLFPTAWAMDGFQDIILRGAGVSQVATPALVLLGFAALFFGLGVWRFKYE